MSQKRLRQFKKSPVRPLPPAPEPAPTPTPMPGPSQRRSFHLGRELRILFANRSVRIYTAVVGCILVTLLTMAAGQLANFLQTSLVADLAKYQIPFTGTVQPIADLPLYNPSNLDPKIYSTAYLGNYMSFNGAKLIASVESQGSHPGVDIVVPTGTPIYAIANGLVVIAAEKNNGFGKQIVIGHPNVPDPANASQSIQLFSSYSHMSEILAQEGAVVNKGDLIGRVGETGTATTPHLHFQIDRHTANFHPYWPFTYNMANAANLSFTQAVTAGLGRENALAHTINPLLYTQAYSNAGPGTPFGVQLASASGTAAAYFVDFKLVNPTTLKAGQTQTITLTAIGLDGNPNPSFVPSTDVRVIVPSERALEGTVIIAASQFQQGQASFSLTPISGGNLSLTVRYGDLRTILAPLTVSGPAATQATVASAPAATGTSAPTAVVASATTPTPTPIIAPATVQATATPTPTLQPPAAPQRFGITTGTGTSSDGHNDGPWQLFNLDYLEPLLTQQTYRITISTQDQAGLTNHQFQPDTPVKLALTGNLAGLVGPRELSANDFTDGRAFVNFTPVKSGQQILRITAGESAYIFTLDVHDPKELEPAQLVIEHTGQAKTGEATTVTFKVLNAFGSLAPTYKPTSFRLSTTDPHGLFHNATLTAADFQDGTALANFIPTIPGATIISATDGTLSASSAPLQVTGAPLITTPAPATPAANLAADFPDVTLAHRNATAIYELKKRGIISGYEDGTFQPDRPVARVEILKVLLTGFGKPVDQNVTRTDFPDVPTSTWYPAFIAAGKQLGIVKGYDNGTFQPQKTVSRIEAIKMLFVAQGIAPEATVSSQPYSDIPLGNWYTGYVAKASALNLADPFGGNLFHPNEGMTRGEVAELIYRLIYVQDKGIAAYPNT